ncbi:hypothetical protein MTO96_018055 [Rhipicephalus appendiculatus]
MGQVVSTLRPRFSRVPTSEEPEGTELRPRFPRGPSSREAEGAEACSPGSELPQPSASEGGQGSSCIVSQEAGPSKSPPQDALPGVERAGRHNVEDFSASDSVMTELSLVLMQPHAKPSEKPVESRLASTESDGVTPLPDDAEQIRSLFCFGC